MLVVQEQNKAIFFPLNEIELESCRLRFEGFTSIEAERNLVQHYGERAPSSKTMRNWFARGGRLHDFYQTYTDEESKNRHNIARHIFQAHIANAARTIVQTMLDPLQSPMTRFRAAQYIINRELGLPSKAIPDTEREDPAVRILREMGIIE